MGKIYHLSDICVDGPGIGRTSDRFPGSGSCQRVATLQHLFAFLLKNKAYVCIFVEKKGKSVCAKVFANYKMISNLTSRVP